ncbi:MAG: ABC transporter permease [Clostridiales bacterium]|nr:ABC transporter permease [Clostridiales bacterium]
MRDMFTVFRFELMNKLKQKSIMVTTILIVAFVFIVACVPTFLVLFSGAGKATPESETPSTAQEAQIEQTQFEAIPYEESEFGYVLLDESIDNETLKTIYPFNQSELYLDENALRDAIENGDIEKGILISSHTSYKLIANDLSMYDQSTVLISEQLSMFNRDLTLLKDGIDPAKVNAAENIYIQSETETLGKNASSGYAFAYVGMFVIYMIVIIYGTSVATSVAREKNDRTMELLITNTTPVNLIFGKVLASTVVSIGQMIVTLLAAVIGIFVNRVNYPEFLLNLLKESMTLDTIVVYILFALFGCLMYYFLYAAVGALVSKVEEVNSAMTPVQFVFIIAFVLCSFGINFPNGVMMRIISIIPFTSPISMFVRYSLTTVAIWELTISIVILIATMYFMSYIAIKIYHMGTLNYGNKIGFFKAVKMVLFK